ncbi:MAG: hypothetical protein ACT6RE_16310 [Flavobacteriales bacterium]
MASVCRKYALFLPLFLLVHSLHAQQRDSLYFKIRDSFGMNILLSSLRKEGKKLQADHSVFYSLVVLYGMESYSNELTAREKHSLAALKHAFRQQLKKYRNPQRPRTINFWPTEPRQQFPGNNRWSRNTRRHIPDDADDNVYMRMLYSGSADPWFDSLLVSNVNGQKLRARNLPARLRDEAVYSTWLGDKMPVEIDICVLSNILLYRNHIGQPYNHYDSLSAAYIRKNYRYARHPRMARELSPQYIGYPTILYHVARFLASEPGFDPKGKDAAYLVSELNNQLSQTEDKLTRIILASSLLRIGWGDPGIPYTLAELESSRYSFFYANAGSVFPRPLNLIISGIERYRMPYFCFGHNYFLAWEYEVLKQKKASE